MEKDSSSSPGKWSEDEVKQMIADGDGVERRKRLNAALAADKDEQKTVAYAHTIVGGQKTGRNKPCPCGSGSKFKKCCMRKGEPYVAYRIYHKYRDEPVSAKHPPRRPD